MRRMISGHYQSGDMGPTVFQTKPSAFIVTEPLLKLTIHSAPYTPFLLFEDVLKLLGVHDSRLRTFTPHYYLRETSIVSSRLVSHCNC